MITPDKYNPCALVDLEGSLSDNSHRVGLIPPDDTPADQASKAWNRYFRRLRDDPAHPLVIDYCQKLASMGVRIVIATGVPDEHRQAVRRWLNSNAVPHHKIFMRANDNQAPAEQLKLAMYQMAVNRFNYTPVVGIDDQPDILQVYINSHMSLCLLARHGKLSEFYNDPQR